MILRAIENQIFRKAAPMAIRHLAKPNLKSQEVLSKQVLNQCAKEFQLAPPLTIHSSDPNLMAGLWGLAREAYVVNYQGRAMREAIAATVSELNHCPYCVTVHSSLFASTSEAKSSLKHSASLSPPIQKAQLWAKATLSPQSSTLKAKDIAISERPQIFATAILYHYLNRMVSIFLEETPVALPGMATSVGEKIMRSSFTFFGKRFARVDPKPGQFILQNKATLPPEFLWAFPDKNVAKALAQFAQIAEQAGQQAVPETVRDLVQNHLSSWNGEYPDLSRAWLEELIAPLNEDEKPSARLALLSARAPWQVDAAIIKAFRLRETDDKALLQTAAWACFSASKRIASWFPVS